MSDYVDVIYGYAYNSSFHKKLRSMQYAYLAIKGVMRRTTSGKINQVFSLESLKYRCWSRRLCNQYKIFNQKLFPYLLV